MAMSAKFRAGIENTVATNDGAESLIDIKDYRLIRLIDGVELAIAHKKLFLIQHDFPKTDTRYLSALEDELVKLEIRLQELNMEKRRRGL